MELITQSVRQSEILFHIFFHSITSIISSSSNTLHIGDDDEELVSHNLLNISKIQILSKYLRQ